MKKIDIGQTVQIIANLGVIAGIVFLGIELQQNNALLGAQARTSRAQLRIDGLQALQSNQALLHALLNQREGQPLTPTEQFLLEIDAMRVLFAWQYVYGEYQAELIDEDDIPIENWRWIFSLRPELKSAWQDPARIGLRPDFVQWMEANVIE
jgi:hypothetical protein